MKKIAFNALYFDKVIKKIIYNQFLWDKLIID